MSPLLTKLPASRGNNTSSGPSATANHDKNLLTDSRTMSSATSGVRVQSPPKLLQNVSMHQIESKCEKPSPQLVKYLQASSAKDPYTGAGPAGVEKLAQRPGRYMEEALKNWDEEWQKVSVKTGGREQATCPEDMDQTKRSTTASYGARILIERVLRRNEIIFESVGNQHPRPGGFSDNAYAPLNTSCPLFALDTSGSVRSYLAVDPGSATPAQERRHRPATKAGDGCAGIYGRTYYS